MSRKTFYTERDIEALAAQGITTLPLNDDSVYTELAQEKARSLGISFVKESAAPQPASGDAPVAQIKAAVIAKLGDTVPESIIDAAIARVLATRR